MPPRTVLLTELIHTHFDSIDSTNTYALKNSKNLKPGELSLTSTSEQTAGRGRFGHKWISGKNSDLIATYSFLLASGRTDRGNIPQVIALTISKTLLDLGIATQAKWPNDLLVQGKKIAGILTETTVSAFDDLITVVVGIGININTSMADLAPLASPATSVSIETGKSHSVSSLLDFLSNHLREDLNRFLMEGFAPFLPGYRQLLGTKAGAPIRFHVNGKILTGFFEEITEKGTLKLRLPDGNVSEFVSGEVVSFQKT